MIREHALRILAEPILTRTFLKTPYGSYLRRSSGPTLKVVRVGLKLVGSQVAIYRSDDPMRHDMVRTCSKADVVFDFGTLVYTAREVALPQFANARPFHIHVQCDEQGEKFPITLMFFQGGHLKAVFPTLPLILMDGGCDVGQATVNEIELVGIFMGEVEE